MKKVANLTDFRSYDSSYSICLDAVDQCKMLLRHGYEPVFIACEGFGNDNPEALKGVEIRHIPNFKRSNRIELDKDWEEDILKLEKALEEALVDIQVCLTHDLIYQPASLKLNIAARRVAKKRPDLRWLHWVHSATTPALLSDSRDFLNVVRQKFPNSLLVYPNSYELPRIAREFGYKEDEVVSIPHPIDVNKFLGFQPLTVKMVEEFNLLDADAIMVYPVRLDRGKQVEFCVRIAAQLKRIGRSVRLLVMDFHSTGGDKVTYRQELKSLAVDQNLNAQELLFTSEFDPSLRKSCPQEMVRDLMLLCNVYVHPSKSESYSRVTQEAGLCGAMLTLNSDWPAMRSIYGKYAFYTGFSSQVHNVGSFWQEGITRAYHKKGSVPGKGPEEGVDAFCHDIANRIAYELDHNMVLAQQIQIRKTRNFDAVFEMMEPLLYAEG